MGEIESALITGCSTQRTASVPAVERALIILDFLARSRRGATVSQLTRALQLPKSSCHALLLTLERAGYVVRDARSGRYQLGLHLFSLANIALTGATIREQGASFLRRLAE